MKERLYSVWLSLKETLSPEQICRLIKSYGSAEAVYQEKSYEKAGMTGRKALEELADKSLKGAEKTVRRMAELGGRIIIVADDEYPALLKESYAPPVVLYAIGQRLPSEKNLTIAVVGVRKCNSYGKAAASFISRELSVSGAIIVSGMAEGIDTFAAKAALEAGGSTIAVLGSGVDVIYPYFNRPLYEEICRRGTVISEYPPGARPIGYHFPRRNRIISGICAGTLVVQAPAKSGSLITARDALEDNRDVFAVPGDIFEPLQVGTNRLIKAGAIPVENARDILACYEGMGYELNVDNGSVQEEKRDRLSELDLSSLGETALRIVKLLNEGGEHMDVIARRLKLECRCVETELMMLEITGVIKKNNQNIYELV